MTQAEMEKMVNELKAQQDAIMDALKAMTANPQPTSAPAPTTTVVKEENKNGFTLSQILKGAALIGGVAGISYLAYQKGKDSVDPFAAPGMGMGMQMPGMQTLPMQSNNGLMTIPTTTVEDNKTW